MTADELHERLRDADLYARQYEGYYGDALDQVRRTTLRQYQAVGMKINALAEFIATRESG